MFYFSQKQGGKPAFESSGSQDSPVPESSPKLPTDSPAKVADETWEDKEGKQNTEPDKPKAAPQLISMSTPNSSYKYDCMDTCVDVFKIKNTLGILRIIHKLSKMSKLYNFTDFYR